MSKSYESKEFSFKAALDKLMASLSERSQDIVRMRFGIDGKKYTLSKIGKKYGITRERVRQIIKESVNKVSESDLEDLLNDARKKIKFTIEKNNGIMLESQLLSYLGKNSQERGSVEFFLQCVEGISFIESKDEMEAAIMSDDLDLSEWKLAKKEAKKFLEGHKETMVGDELFGAVKSFSGKKFTVSKDTFLAYLEVSKEIKKNSFGKWGLSKWSEISPKGARQKAYLVMREIGKPLHFREVASLIDDYNLSERKSHPQTVHNELIKDKKFVLVGRGVYALSEWGYEKGTVKEVIEDILKKSKKPMRRNDILTQALAVRKVKRSTVVINLNNFFDRVEDDLYTIKK